MLVYAITIFTCSRWLIRLVIDKKIILFLPLQFPDDMTQSLPLFLAERFELQAQPQVLIGHELIVDNSAKKPYNLAI